MPSNAFATHLTQLLRDADELDDAHALLSVTIPPPQHKLDAINRAVVVVSVSAWETYVEELVVEAVLAIAQRPARSALGPFTTPPYSDKRNDSTPQTLTTSRPCCRMRWV